MDRRDRRRRVHYGWLVVFGGALTFFSCLGLARFAFGMILPAMGEGLGLGYDEMGYIGTANFAGYLACVAAAPWFMRRFGGRWTVSGGLVVIGVCLAAMSRGNSFWVLLGLYCLTGVGSGLATVPAVVLVGRWVSSSLRGRALGFMSVGSGAGIIFSGFLVPGIHRAFGPAGWRIDWLVLGCISLGMACLVAGILRNTPAEMGLAPLGSDRAPEDRSGVPLAEPGDSAAAMGIILRLGVLYLLFGATYMIYGTFIVTSMVQEYGLAEASAGRFWAWVGFLSMFSGVLFGALSDRVGRKWGLTAVFAVQAVAYGLVGGHFGAPALYLSVAFYGLAAWAVPTIMGAAVVEYLGPARAASGLSAVTLFFGAGQTVGPALAGVVAQASQSFSPSFLVASALAGLGAVLASRLRSARLGGAAPSSG